MSYVKIFFPPIACMAAYNTEASRKTFVDAVHRRKVACHYPITASLLLPDTPTLRPRLPVFCSSCRVLYNYAANEEHIARAVLG